MIKNTLVIDSLVLLQPVSVDIWFPYPQIKDIKSVVWALHSALTDASLFKEQLCCTDFVSKNNSILVMPSLANSFFANTNVNLYQDFLTKELCPYLKDTFGIDKYLQEGIGISMGAYGLLLWALSDLTFFDNINLISGVYNIELLDSQKIRGRERSLKAFAESSFKQLGLNNIDKDYVVNSINKDKVTKAPSVNIFAGIDDTLAYTHSLYLYDLLKDNGFAVSLDNSDGGHDTEYWARVIDVIKNPPQRT